MAHEKNNNGITLIPGPRPADEKLASLSQAWPTLLLTLLGYLL